MGTRDYIGMFIPRQGKILTHLNTCALGHAQMEAQWSTTTKHINMNGQGVGALSDKKGDQTSQMDNKKMET